MTDWQKAPVSEDAEKPEFGLVWPIHAAGYEWTDREMDLNPVELTILRTNGILPTLPRGKWLIPRSRLAPPRTRPLPVLASRPYLYDWPKDLHREFAGLPPTEDAYRTFANRFGLLGVRQRLWESQDQQVSRTQGECFGDWRALVETLALLIKTWDLLQKGDDRSLAALLPRLERHAEVEVYRSDDAPETFLGVAEVSAFTPIVGTARMRTRDVLWMAEYHLVDAINLRLAHFARPVVLPFLRREVAWMPINLLGVLYMLLAAEIEGRFDRPRQCLTCKKTIEGRRQKRYCGTSCQYADWYRKNRDRRRASGRTEP